MSRWTPTPLLRPVADLQVQIDRSFVGARNKLQALLPGCQVHHVGSTALAPLLTRGIIDIEVITAVASKDTTLAAAAAQTKSSLPLSIQFLAAASPAVRIRQTLAENPLWLGEYLGLQKRFVHTLRKPYPRAKGEFFESLIASPGYEAVDVAHMVPYLIELETDRMHLRSELSTDAADFCALREANRAHLEAYGGPVREDQLDVARNQSVFAKGPMLRWRRENLGLMLRHKKDGRLMGACHFSGFVWRRFRTCNLGYLIAKEFEGQGYMREACVAALDYVGSEWGIHRVQAMYDASNTRSANLARRLGMKVEGTARDFICQDQKWHDAEIASLILAS